MMSPNWGSHHKKRLFSVLSITDLPFTNLMNILFTKFAFYDNINHKKVNYFDKKKEDYLLFTLSESTL